MLLRSPALVRTTLLGLAGILCGASVASIGCAAQGASNAALQQLAKKLNDGRQPPPDFTAIHWMGVVCIALAIVSAVASAAVPSMARPRVSITLLLCGVGAIYLAFILAQPWTLWVLSALCAVSLALFVWHFVSVKRERSAASSLFPAMPAASGGAA